MRPGHHSTRRPAPQPITAPRRPAVVAELCARCCGSRPAGSPWPVQRDGTASACKSRPPGQWSGAHAGGHLPAVHRSGRLRMSDVADFADWRELAACVSENPELFFPISGTARGLGQARRAKAVCGSCPVRQRCLDYALDTRQAYGIWGGLGEDERVSLRAALGRGEPGRAGGWPGSAERAVDCTRERTRLRRNVLPPHRG